MPVLQQPDSGIRRSAIYSYLRPAFVGRRVLEIGCGGGESTAYLVKLGARSVVGAGQVQDVNDARKRHRDGALGFVSMGAGLDTSGPFDVVLVPDAAGILRGQGPLKLSTLLALVAPGGRLVCVAENGDQGDGLGYYDFMDTLSPHFSKVRMFGQTPFVGFGVAEFDDATASLRVETDLAAAEEEAPSHYIALAGPDEPLELGYALVQIPAPGPDAPAVAHLAGAGTRAPETAISELRHRLAEVEGKADGLVRVSKAQVEEIEELRARLRRTAEARAELDEEVRRLRRALIEADESVVSLTKRTAEEMTALTQRLTSGLRGDDRAKAPLADELKRHETLLAERESALSERDDRIANLETTKQEAEWRLAAVEEELSQARLRLQSQKGDREQSLVDLQRELGEANAKAQADADALKALRAQVEEMTELLRQRDQAIEGFNMAGAMHLEELRRLRDAENEQASHIAELEEENTALRQRQADLEAAAKQARESLAEVEDADRQRRSRLAELEGKMMRLEREQASRQGSQEAEREEVAGLQAKVQELQARIAGSEGQTAEAERLRGEVSAANVEIERLRGEISASGAEIDRLRGEVSSSNAEIERLGGETSAANAECERLRGEVSSSRAECERLRAEEAGLVSDIAALRITVGEVAQLRAQLATVSADAAALREAANTVTGLHAQLDAAGAELTECRARLQACVDAHAALEQAVVAKDAEATRLNEVLRAFEEKERRLAELRAEAPDPEEVYERLYDLEMQYQSATMAAARVPTLEARVAELEARLR